MYDYLNISADTYYMYWLQNSCLNFQTLTSLRTENIINESQQIVDTTTGEILHRTATANDKNLEFKIKPSHINPGQYHCTLSGSIHKYHNQGRHNADTFHYYDFIQEINQLRKTYDLDPARCKINSFEFGVNIQLPPGITAKEFINSIVSMPAKRFSTMNAKKVNLGKISKFTNHDLKIYDKPGQLSDNTLFDKRVKLPENTVRIEIRIKRMRFLKQYGLYTDGKPIHLADLMRKEFAAKLGEILTDQVSKIIYYDTKLNLDNLTGAQKMRMLRFQNPLYWEHLDRKQRARKKAQFAEYLSRCNHFHISDKITATVGQKVKQILSGNDKNGVQKHQKNLPCKYHILGTKTPFKCRVHLSTPSNKIKKRKKNTPTVKHFCKTCGRDISHQRTGSVYCSEKIYGAAGKRCRNAGLYQKRKTKSKKLIAKETQHLEQLKAVKWSKTTRLNITLNTGQKLRPTIHQLIAWPWNQRRQIIELKTKGHKLTRSRAKKYVKFLKTNKHENIGQF